MSKTRRKPKKEAIDYFVTGATGFIGRRLVERLLARPEAKVYALVREQSRSRFDECLSRWRAQPGRVVPVIGDVTAPRLGIAPKVLAGLRGHVGHFFHVAGLYDMSASEPALEQINVRGTEHAVAAAERMGARCFHHISSIAAAGRYRGVFRESMFDEATDLHDPYFRTKHDSERVVRKDCQIPWRIYRPAIVVGDSQSGEMDKVDGPYYFFPALEWLAAALPPFLPLPGIDGGSMNIVPVDFVVAAIDHIAHRGGLDGKTFHLVDPHTRSVGETLDAFAEAAGAPQLSLRLVGAEAAVVPVARALSWTANGFAGGLIEKVVGVPPRVLDYATNPTVFDCRETLAALEGSGIAVPPLESYARRLWVYWQRNLNANTAHARRLDEAVRGKHVLITGASSGIGRATALKRGPPVRTSSWWRAARSGWKR